MSQQLYSTQQIKQLEVLAVENYAIPESILMERAGKATFDILQEKYAKAKFLTIFCGKGNNAGDGYVLARLAAEHSYSVTIYYLGALDALKGSAKAAYEKCKSLGLSILPFDQYQVAEADIYIDALLGTGFEGELKEEFKQAVFAINKADKPVISIDIPSGLEANTGYVSTIAVKANDTVTFIGKKQGLFTGDGSGYAGEVICNTLDLPIEAYQAIKSEIETPDFKALKKQYLPTRAKNTHKGDFGHVLVIGGDYGMGGAVRMSAEAAYRAGAGLVSVATHAEHLDLVNVGRPEIMCHAIEDANVLIPLLEKATVLAIGTGLGQTKWGDALLEKTLTLDKPLVVDADALNLLSKGNLKKTNWILTPHVGEAARLLKTTIADIQANRFEAIRTLQAERGGVCVLKGAGTLIKGEEEKITVCTAGNAGMAKGGMGDVLTGVIAGLLAQGLNLRTAADLGVMLHSKAADEAVKEKGEKSLLAMDLIVYLQNVIKDN